MIKNLIERIGSRVKGVADREPCSIAGQARAPFLISSVPKCGLRWLSSILADLGFNRFPEANDLHGDMIRAVDLAVKKMKPGDFFSHHINFEIVAHILKGKSFPCFVLCRDPRDAAISLYHFHQKKGVWLDKSFDSVFEYELMWRIFRNFVFYGLHWIERYENTHLIKYEDLLADPVATINTILKAMECEAEDQLVRTSVDKFDRSQIMDADDRVRDGLHFRTGVIGEHREIFSPRQQAIYEMVMGEVHRKLGYDL